MQLSQPELLATVDPVRFFRVDSRPTGGAPRSYPLVWSPPSAVVLPYDEEGGYFVLTCQQRVGTSGAAVLEVPGGTPEAGEDCEVCARRELREETGLEAAKWELVASETYVSPGHSNKTVWLFLAGGLTEIPVREAERGIELWRISFARLDHEIERYALGEPGPRKDLRTLALLQALKLRRGS